jgi:hypothetical protein
MESEVLHNTLKVINEQYSNKYISFYTWLTYNSDIEFLTIYKTAFENYELKDLEKAHDYGINLANAIWCFYEVERDISKLNIFIKKFINCQFNVFLNS